MNTIHKTANNSISFKEIIASLSDERKLAMTRLWYLVKEHIPQGFTEHIDQEMLHFVVPHSVYKAGYHCNPSQPLPFISLASQKNAIVFYHMGMYCDKRLLEWFKNEYPNYCTTKLDMGKSCIRFKKMADIPYTLMAELCRKITVQQWISCYEATFQPKK